MEISGDLQKRRWDARLFAATAPAVSRGLLLRDALLGVACRLRRAAGVEEFFLESGGRRLAAAWVAAEDDAPAILICHGIGETVEHWSAVQAFLQEHRVSSMVFNYSGYGRSSGAIRAENCDQDLVSAYAEVRRRVGAERPVFVLGFSMGSGIAGCGAGRLNPPPAGLFLCEAFTSFREATRATGVPGWIARYAPNIWDTLRAMQSIQMPVCVLHSDADRVFPVEMARRIVEACGSHGELVIVKGLRHNEPYLNPTDEYWGVVVERVMRAVVTRRV